MGRDNEPDGSVISGSDGYDGLVRRVNIALGKGEEVRDQIPPGLVDQLRAYQSMVRQLQAAKLSARSAELSMTANDTVLEAKAFAYAQLQQDYGRKLYFRVEGEFV